MTTTSVPPNNRASSFAANLRAERARAGMLQRELADRLGVTTATIINWENGKSVPLISTAVDIADLLGVSLDYLAGRL